MPPKHPLQPPTPETIDAFIGIVGTENAITDVAAMAPFLTEWRDRFIGKAALILRPSSTEEVSAILSLANERLIGVVPQGGNTGLVGGQIPSPAGEEILISLARLNRVREIDAEGYTMTVEAGLPLERAQAVADKADRLFPLSLASEGSCQIGGVLATNAGGMAVLAYGNARELALGVEAVLADGQIWNGLKALRKDNTGYDLKDLFIGSEGTLGIITAAILRLFPKPLSKSTALVALADLDRAVAFYSRAFERAASSLTAFEIIPRIGIEFVLRHFDGVRDPFVTPHPWYVLCELSHFCPDDQAAKRLETILSEASEAGEIEDAVVAASLGQAQDFWRLRELMSEAQKYEGGSIKHDIAVPVARVPEFIDRADKLVSLMVPGARPVPFGHLGDGNIHYNVSQPPGMDTTVFLAQWEALNMAVHEIVLDLGGSISGEHGIGQLKRDLLPHAKSPVELALMRKIKNVLDPNGILNPGKVL
jgi:FAD/FMN-containing dehydrogenase